MPMLAVKPGVKVIYIYENYVELFRPRGHMTSFRRRYDVNATSHILSINVETTLSV